MYKIYLDDLRVPKDSEWILVKNYDQFVDKVIELELKNISIISFDHDLGYSAIQEYYNNVITNKTINYDNIKEKTGYDCVKWLINHYLDNENINQDKFVFPKIYVHSANPVGAKNIMDYVNNFLNHNNQQETCVKIHVPHLVFN